LACPDGVPKVTGRAQYGADLMWPGMLVGRILRSPHAHARIRSINIEKAKALPGVKAVVTSADFPEQPFAYVGPERVAQNLGDAQHHGAREGSMRVMGGAVAAQQGHRRQSCR
jgi:CO/xanthine dehydrogenase Mo-binding subunit